MAVLELCPKHNMVAYLEKTEGNAEFHEVIDFLARSSIHHALTISPVVSTTFVEQFWMSAKSKIINNVRYITSKVAGKPVSISEASIRSDLLFDDADGIDSLPNQAIFDAIQLMGYEGDLTVLTFNKALFSPQWRHLDAKKMFVMYPRFISIFLDKQLVNVPVPLDHFPVNALTSKDEGATSEDETSVPTYSLSSSPSEANRFLVGIKEVTNQAKEIKTLKAQIKKLKKQAKPVISHHKAWMKSLSLKQRLAGKKSLKSNWMQKESVSKEGRKFAKAKPSVHKDPLFDELDDDEIDNMDTEDAHDVGRSKDVVNEEKENADAEVSTEDEKVSTDTPKVSTDGSKVSTERTYEGTDEQTEGRRATQTIQTTQTPTSTMFGDDETIARVLLNMSQAKAVSREKEKGVEFKDVEETERPKPTSTRSLLTLKPLPKIDPKDKGKKKIEEEDESETESEGIPEAEKKFYDDIKARIEADRLLAERLQEEEREQFTVEERAKFLHDIIAAQRRFLAQQRSEAIRNKPPTKNQLRNQMMTYLKHVGNFQHSHLKTKKFEEIQALYEKIKRSDEDFIAIGSAEDERMIKEMNEKGIDSSKNESVKEEGKEEEDDDSDDEHRKCLKIVTFEGILDSEIMEKKSVIARLDKTKTADRQDLCHLYELMMELYLEMTLEEFELILWGRTEDNNGILNWKKYDQSDFWSISNKIGRLSLRVVS
ncbi:hypothetical protein Tco_1555091 [Tanacetum coccineum]